MPAELPGSTPGDLAHAENMDIYTPSNLRMSSDAGSRRPNTRRRSRTHAESIRSFLPPDMRTRESIDVDGSLSTLTEATIERNDSTKSMTTTVTKPLVAKRYRARAVNLQNQRRRHISLPSQLPLPQSQSSLSDDLANWVLPSTTHEQISNNERKGSPVLSSPTTSVASGSAVAQVPTRDSGVISNLNSNTAESTPKSSSDELQTENQNSSSPLNYDENEPNHQDIPEYGFQTESVSFASPGTMPHNPSRTPSTQSSSSILQRKPLPTTLIDTRSTVALTEAALTRFTSLQIQHTRSGSESSPEYASRQASLVSSSRSPPLSSVLSSHDAELSLIQQRMLAQNYTEQSNFPISSSPEEQMVPISLQSIPEHSAQRHTLSEGITSTPSDSVVSLGAPKLMSAQAKRQAAQRRRMEKAFGQS